MTTITLEPLWHKQKKHIAIKFEYNVAVKNVVKSYNNVRWSKTHRTFYIPYSTEEIHNLFLYFRKQNWFVDYSAFKKVGKTEDLSTKKPELISKLPQPANEQIEELQQFKRWLEQKRFSANTVLTYTEVTKLFLRYMIYKDLETITSRTIEQFNYDFIFNAKKSVSYQNQCISGIKHFMDFKGIMIDELDIKRPNKDKKLPTVFTKEEVKRLIDVTKNLKHKVLLVLVYSAGLRIGEALQLKINDIDYERSLIHIKSAKGRKDRYTLLSKNLFPLIDTYLRHYSPDFYLFEGRSGKPYTQVSAREVFRKSLRQSGIKKQGTLHTLRHSFATHLLESGTDIRYIQELLGHSSPKTTMIYTHVSTTNLKEIKNPFDSM
ncbi:tyrosine-type recombinase/integrase [Jejuia pallidilutea]|uniref:Mobile element protein n=1 Tax=Jejuia pallidilutea TaxID=504487 RepID=A0A090VUJ2_9FLAO|nr:tyrosine-type recombinase/integrase [Jejuia pallidilutea]GAL67658.1 mobile element protein [Jejuia pallidilutea]GAL72046.1 mobile element protein [Jejuia pallidilutea]GAL88382.1 mobile element protein [Jejuia pallidilutea]